MNRGEFIRELEYLLQDIPEEERADAIAYYRDYLEDAGEEHEAEAIREFGSPERVAAIIRADLGGSLEKGGTFTERGYQDERFQEPRYQVAAREKRGAEEASGSDPASDRRQGEGGDGFSWEESVRHREDSDWRQGGGSRSYSGAGEYKSSGKGFLAKGSPGSQVLKIILIAALVCMAAPVFLGIGGGIAGIAAGLISLLVALLLLAAVLTGAAWIGGIALLVLGMGLLFVYPWSGVLVIGCGIFVLGLAFLGVAVCLLVYGKLIPFCVCGIVNWTQRLLYRNRRDRT